LPTYQKVDIPITLPQLQVLSLDGDQHLHNTFHMSNILMNLAAPKLRKLEIVGRSGLANDGSIAPEPLLAIRTLLARSEPPLERLNIQSITILPEHFIACLRLAPDLVDLVVQNWALRMDIAGLPMGPPGVGEGEQQTMEPLSGENRGEAPADVPENLILTALTLKRTTKQDKLCGPAGERIEQDEEVVATQSSTEPDFTAVQPPSRSSEHLDEDNRPLCPRLQRFDVMLCDASQMLFCDFVASRWKDVPDGVAKIRSVKCNFHSVEDEAATQTINRFQSEGLVAFVTHQAPIIDDLNPSPWAGLEGPP
jgi:hypothetical protein